MYKVQNVSGGALPISLEKGSTILPPNKSIDLDGLCSRKFIKSSKELAYLLNPNLNALVLVHDSEQGVPSQTIKDIRPGLPGGRPTKVKEKEKAIIVDFSNIGEPEQEDPIIEDLGEPEVEEPEVEEPEDVDKPVEFEEPVEIKQEIKDGEISCTVCGKPCKGERGLKAHMRVHEDD